MQVYNSHLVCGCTALMVCNCLDIAGSIVLKCPALLELGWPELLRIHRLAVLIELSGDDVPIEILETWYKKQYRAYIQISYLKLTNKQKKKKLQNTQYFHAWNTHHQTIRSLKPFFNHSLSWKQEQIPADNPFFCLSLSLSLFFFLSATNLLLPVLRICWEKRRLMVLFQEITGKVTDK